MSGPEFFQTRMGHRFFESTMPALVKQLELLNKNLEDQPIPFLPTQAGRRFRSDRPNEANKPKSLWDYNEIQFARLLCEIRAACEMEGFDQVMESMDLDDEQMDELWRRAEEVWGRSKATYCPPSGMNKFEFTDEAVARGRLKVAKHKPLGVLPMAVQLDKIMPHMTHYGQLEVVMYGSDMDEEGPQHIDSLTVECTRCGCVVAELYNVGWQDEVNPCADLINKLAAFFEQEEQVTGSELDDYVHDMASQNASNINNSSVRDQLRFLLDQAGEKWMRETLLPVLEELT